MGFRITRKKWVTLLRKPEIPKIAKDRKLDKDWKLRRLQLICSSLGMKEYKGKIRKTSRADERL